MPGRAPMTEPRQVQTAGYARIAVPPAFGAVPKLDWLPIAKLVIDPEYQRDE